ncbi:MAG: sodium/solute symporter, partial [Bacteroidota bacterium]
MISIIAYVLTKISVTIFAGALVFEVMLGVPFWTGATLVVVATGVYTVFGGLRAVIYTDMMQMFVLVGGALAMGYFGFESLAEQAGNGASGWDTMMQLLSENQDSEGSADYFNLWRSFEDSNYPWTGIVFGAPILGIWYWCTDQFIVQRVLSAKNLSHARKGTLFGGFLKLTPIFLFVIPGILAYTLSLNNPELLMNSQGEVDYDAALPALVMNYLPVGFKGLVVAGLLAALMSSLSSVFNSCSTLYTIDFYKKKRPDASEKQLVRVGQIATGVLVLIGLAWIPMMKSMTEGEGIFKYLQSIQAYISPPIAAVFLLGLFFRRINAQGAMASLWTGFVVGISRLVAEYVTSGYEQGTALWNIAPDSILAAFVGINFLHFALFLFVICSVVMVFV